MLDIFRIRYVRDEIKKEIVNLVLDFLSFCKDRVSLQPSLKTSFTEDYSEELAMRWMKLREEIFFYNKGQLQILSFIVEKPKS